MVDYATILKKIHEQKKLRFTTQELLERGLTDYYIRKLMTLGELKRVERGVYEITKNVNEEKSIHFFNKFAKSVFQSDYAKAYDYLKLNYQYKVGHDYDNHLRIYFILLETLLNLDYDSDNLEDIFEFTEEKNDTYYNDFILFRECVMSHDFSNALFYLRRYRQNVRERKGYYNLSTRLFWQLTNAIYFKRKEENKNQSLEEEKLVSHSHYYEEFVRCYKSGDFEQALENIRLASQNQENHADMEVISTMLHDFLCMNEELVLKDENAPFIQAIQTKDYLRAYQIMIDANRPVKEDSPIYFILDLLTRIYEKNQSIIESQWMDEKILNEQKEQDLVEKQQRDYQEIIDFVYQRDYKTAKEKIDVYSKMFGNSQLFTILSRLITSYQDLISKRVRPTVFDSYVADSFDCFKYFFEALRNHDYEVALDYSRYCQERLVFQGKNTQDFELYEIVLQDILKQCDEISKEEERKNEREQVNKKLNYLIFKVPAQSLSIEELHQVLNRQLEFATDLEAPYITSAILLLDTVFQVQQFGVREGDFETFSYSSGYPKNILEAMQQGDYISARDFAFSEDWNIQKIDSSFRKYFTLYRKLFRLLDISLRNNQSPVSIECEPKGKEEEVDIHQKIITLVKKRHYYKAYELYLSHLDSFGEAVQVTLDLWLRTLAMMQKHEQDAVLECWNQSFKRGDYDSCELHFENLESITQEMGVDSNYDVLKQSLECQKKDVWSSDFVKRMQLYSLGDYYYSISDYLNCISVMDEYISMDSERTNQGYFLRGLAYEQLKDYTQAEADYQKASSILPSSSIYQRLGFLQMMRTQYDEALQSFLLAERLTPNNSFVIDSIIQIYHILHHVEEEEKYKIKSRNLEKLS